MINKRGNLGVTIVVSITFFVVGLMFINFLTPEIITTRASVTGLNCANASAISDGAKLTCLAVDLVIPYFILLIFSAAGGYITAKFIIWKN